jgi:hypothetical protein
MDKLINDKNNNRKGNSMTDSTATAESAQAKPSKDNGQPPVNGKSQTKPQAKYGRVISNPNEVAHLVMMRIKHWLIPPSNWWALTPTSKRRSPN